MRHSLTAFVCAFLVSVSPADAADWYVAANGSGNGSASSPFGRIQQAIDTAQPGDTIIVGPGTFNEVLTTVRGGSPSARITLRSSGGRGSTLITAAGRVLSVNHPYFTVDGLVLDGQYGANDLIVVASAAQGFTLRNAEVRRSGQDGVDIRAAADVVIENSLVHHTLNSTNGRTDAHGIVGGAVQRLTIRNTEIHTFSGDGVQVDPGRSAPGWNDVVIEGCRIWLAPLPVSQNGFPAGTVTGENAVDTKASFDLPRARITIRDTVAYGFRWPTTGNNIAAFNLKEHIDAVVDRVTVHDSEIGFRLRGGDGVTPGAHVRVQNAVVHSVDYGVRYENNIQNLRFWNSTFGGGVKQAFLSASSSGSVLDVQNVLVLGASLPSQAPSAGLNLAVPASAFVDASAHNYQLASQSPAVDAGTSLSEVSSDRQGTRRPQGGAYDVGAYERVVLAEPTPTEPTPTDPTPTDPTPAPTDPTPTPTDPVPDPDLDTNVVLYAANAMTLRGNWNVVPDTTAAGGLRVESYDLGDRRVNKAAVHPTDYFELTFQATAGVPYRLWLRGKASANSADNDSVFVQFSDAVTQDGTPVYRIGTTSATIVNLEDCNRCGLSGWGWQDNGGERGTLGAAIYFASTGTHTVRIQTREDGFSLDQIVLSPSDYLSASPGSMTNDTTILVQTHR